ncbi:hypothetical protein [Paraherbaspirillum soli]|uniref:Uncharacterized protein n=1 Tax=Paraherbaspirillum soli TaxID=631222 RepID=A0ABW0M9I6_9BURK
MPVSARSGGVVVFLALSRAGLESFKFLRREPGFALWVGAGVLEESEIEELWAEGANVSIFAYEISANDAEAVAGAIDTIKEHHPHAVVWIEYVAPDIAFAPDSKTLRPT